MKNFSFINHAAIRWAVVLLLVLMVRYNAVSQLYYPICPGESYTLKADTGLNNYQWYTISGIDTTAISGANSMSYTTSATGAYIWKATDDAGCLVQLCEPVNIVTGACLNPPDTSYQICPGETYTLTAQTGLSNYQWYVLAGGSEVLIPGANNVSYIASSTGTYLWTARDANNCEVKLCTPVKIEASASCAPCADTSYQICPGESYTLTAQPGMASYQWYTISGTDTTAISGQTNISYIATTAGTYIWKAKDANGCDVSLCCPVEIVVGACTPCPDTAYQICPGESYTLSAQSGLTNYQWYTISGTDTLAIAGATSLNYTATAAGTYFWKAKDANGCEVSLCCPVKIVDGTCFIPCSFAGITAVPGACDPAANEYSVGGMVSFSNPPLTGTLTVTSGTKTQVFNAPFTSPIAYSLSGLLSDGAVHSVSAVFSADPLCGGSVNFTAPSSCACADTSYQICPGESYTLTAQPGMASYQWFTKIGTDTTAISGETNISYIATATGTYFWRAKDANGCDVTLCCPVEIVAGTCTPCPDTAYQICPGESYTLSAQSGLTNYQWYTISGTDTLAIAGATSVNSTATTTGTYIWKAKDANGCEVKLCCPVKIVEGTCIIPCSFAGITAVPGACDPSTDEHSVSGMVSFSNPPLTGTLTVTSGTKTQVFNAPFTSPIAYSLSGLLSDGGVHSVSAVFSADPLCGGSVSYTAPTSCSCIDTMYQICPGESYTLTAQSGLTDYQWYTISGTDTTAISGATGQTYTATTTGTYIWKAKDANGCEVKLCCPVKIVEGTCIIPCSFAGITAVPGACDPSTNEYSVSGMVSFSNPPLTGTLTVTSGTKTQVFNAPFTSPIAYSLSGLLSDGGVHSVSAVFSADPLCGGSVSYTAPTSCSCIDTMYQICPGESYTLTAQSGLTDYQWYTISGTDTTAISGATGQTYTATTTGTYIWKAKDANGCEVELCCPVKIVEGTCIIPCSFAGITAVPGACDPSTNEYSVSGMVSFSNPPLTGTLTVTSGTKTQVFNAPFTSPIAYSLSGLLSDGGVHSVSAVFSADPLCGGSVSYTAPTSCSCIDTMYQICPGESYTLTAQSGLTSYQWYTISGTDTTAISGATGQTYTATTTGTYIWKAKDANGCEVKLCCPVKIVPGNCLPCVHVTAISESCASPEGKYTLTGTVTFQTPPASGNLVIKVGPHTIIVPAPVMSPYFYTFTDLPADGAVHTVTAYFTGNQDCTDSESFTAPLKRCVPIQVIKN